jgi:hypothetical protein
MTFELDKNIIFKLPNIGILLYVKWRKIKYIHIKNLLDLIYLWFVKGIDLIIYLDLKYIFIHLESNFLPINILRKCIS